VPQSLSLEALIPQHFENVNNGVLPIFGHLLRAPAHPTLELVRLPRYELIVFLLLP